MSKADFLEGKLAAAQRQITTLVKELDAQKALVAKLEGQNRTLLMENEDLRAKVAAIAGEQ